MNNDSTEGERFVDEAEKPIPPKDTWGQLSPNEMIDVKNQLEEKLWAFGNNPAIAKVLREGVDQLTALISASSGKMF